MAERYRFQILGPFDVPTVKKRGSRKIDFKHNRARNSVFEQAERAFGAGVKEAIGCYVFGISPPGGPRTWPYYVGKACDQTLYCRLFQLQDKPNKYNDILWQYYRGKPFVYLLPLLTPGGALAKLGTNRSKIDLAEKTLIGMAMRVNPELWNIQHVRALDSFMIDGISKRRGKPSEAAKRFRTMIDRPQPKEIPAVVSEHGLDVGVGDGDLQE